MIHQEKIQENLPSFTELILSWNGDRPQRGSYHFYVRLKIHEWTPWVIYASWGAKEQSSFLVKTTDAPVRVYQDIVEVLDNNKASGFQIKIIADGEARLENIHSTHVYINIPEKVLPTPTYLPIHLNVKGLSQMTLNHPRAADLCSPTSTTSVIRYLTNNPTINPVHFADNSWDKGFDLFGNWVFNVAEASALLGPKWYCWVERLSGFEDIYERLTQATPVIVSVKGPLANSALPYAKGHLMVVIGYEPSSNEVICMDPAFPCDDQTIVRYEGADFLAAWNRRGRIAYIFSKKRT